MTYQTLKDYPDDLQQIDYYTILNISKKDSEDIDLIKKQYKRQAIKFHPDRQKTEEDKQKAHELFALLQAAYKTFLDPQEKAYYDRNKDLLHDKDAQDFFQRESITINIQQYMNQQLWGNDQQKFYSIVNQIIAQIQNQEYESARMLIKLNQSGALKLTKQHYSKIIYRYTNTLKSFGDEKSQNADILDFYSQWQSFSTVKLFKSADRYSGEGENSKIRGLVDKENENFRQQARQAYNNQIRGFIDFIQQYDKRLKAIQQEKELRQLQQQEQIQKEIKQRKQAKIDKQNQFLDQYQQRIKELEAKLKNNTISQSEILEYERLTLQGNQQALLEKEKMWIQQEKQSNKQSTKEEKSVDYNADITPEEKDQGLRYNSQTKKLFCSICNQQFQLKGQFKTHLTSKKHKKALEELKPKKQVEEKPKESKEEKKQKKNEQQVEQQTEKQNDNQNQFKCLKCKASFPSKTKLFEHIRKTGHAALKTEVEIVEERDQKNKNGKKHKK